MEGIFDGRAVDHCFHCALLYPADTGDDCPVCGRRMRYLPASLMSDVDLRHSLGQKLGAYTAAAQPGERWQGLLALLEHLHAYAPATLSMLADLGGPSLDDLRRDYEALGPGSAK